MIAFVVVVVVTILLQAPENGPQMRYFVVIVVCGCLCCGVVLPRSAIGLMACTGIHSKKLPIQGSVSFITDLTRHNHKFTSLTPRN